MPPLAVADGVYDAVADLPLSVESTALDQFERDTSSGFTRTTTVFELRGEDATGRGEDVTYDADDHEALAVDPPELPVPFEGTFDEFSRHVDDVDLFPEPPASDSARHYRRWAVESAALDLALRQADTDLASALARSYDPVRFVVSTRLGDPPTLDRIERLIDISPGVEFKLDPTSDWTPDLVDALAEMDRVRVLDLKGAYEGTTVDQPPDPELYRLVVERFPDAVIEDPALTESTRPIFDGHENRVAWDYPITGVDSVRELPFEPDWLNVKPSRFGTVRSLFETVAYARERGMELYGGGQFELAVGRGQIQLLAALLYPEAPNDVAPGGYNDPTVGGDLPTSPLAPPSNPSGFRWQ